MSPTIWGDHASITCPGCGIQWRANWQVELRPKAGVPCWNCGFQPEIAFVDAEAKLGDLIEVDTDAYQGESLSPTIGEIVAIQDSQGTRIKRIVAVADQTVSVHDGNLFCDDQKMTSPAPWIEVHNDAFRHEGKSWWQPEPQNFARSAAWKQTTNGFSVSLEGSENQAATLIYCHRAPYNGLRPDRVRDDYACNLVESRKLHEVDELVVTADVEVTRETQLSWWNWRQASPVCQTQRLPTGFHRVAMRWDKPNEITPDDPIPANIRPEQPISLIVQQGAMNLSQISIHRPIVYWIDEKRSPMNFPLRLKPGEYFVIGDNVPFSVDSRNEGVVLRRQIVGKVVTEFSALK